MHRPKYDDWSFPKGKVDPGEHVTAAAVREVAEETGLDVRLGPPLTPQHYTVRNGADPRQARALLGRRGSWASDDVSTYRPNDEIDEVAWVAARQGRPACSPTSGTARRSRESQPYRKKSHPLVVLRHGKARVPQDAGRATTGSGR